MGRHPLMRRLVLVATAVLAACHSASPTSVGPTSDVPMATPHITAFRWRNNTATLACENLLTGADAAAISCSADAAVPVRITVTDVLGDCSSSPLPYGSRCKTIEGTSTANGYWEAPWGPGATETAMTVTVTCEVLDARGGVADTRTTCVPSIGYAHSQHYFKPPWPDSCQAQLLACHGAP